VAGGVKITWRPPSRWTDGTGLAAPLSYVVQRKKAGSSSWKTVAEGVEGLSFYDREIDRTSLYVYRVIAVYSCAGTEIPGPESGETEPAGVLDTDAPDVPESVTAISGNRGVVIRWDASVEPDVFGYNIYRISPGGLAIKLNARPVILNRFVDRTKLMPGKYSYSVTAVDSSANANESAMSPGATVVIR
jgi:fibronectin type 3 domain-containing protein